MKHTTICMLVVLMSIASTKGFAYDFSVKNSDGKIIYYNYSNGRYSVSPDDVYVTYSSSSYSGSINIPRYVTYNNKQWKVVAIGEQAFKDCKRLTSVHFYDTVTSIDNEAFAGCSELKSVYIPNSVRQIGYKAFSYSRLGGVRIPSSVVSIGDSAFDHCVSMASVTIENGVKEIGDDAFSHCVSLRSVEIPNSVTSIRSGAFWRCEKLTSVTIGTSVTDIGISAFCGCSLTSVTIPNSVTIIRMDAFAGSALTSVTIGSGVTSIESGAFDNNNLATVISKIETPFAIPAESSTSPVFCDPVFSDNSFMNANLIVPKGTIDKYKTTEGWKNFVWITEDIPSGVEGVKTDEDNTEVSRYTLDGKKLSEPQEGINIIKMSDGTTKKVIVK